MSRHIPVAIACLSLIVACGGQQPSPGPGPVSARAIARGAVETLESAWIIGAQACRGVAQDRDDQDLAHKCAEAFLPSRGALLAAAAGVDAWSDADQKNVPCVLSDLLTAFDKADVLLVSMGVQVPNQVSQGLELAAALAPTCARPAPDAGE